jgi:dTMP kinase
VTNVAADPDSSRGLLVAVEGVDHAGKTTLTAALAKRLRERGVTVACRREPSDGPIGTQFRRWSAADPPMSAPTMALLSAADRHEQQPGLLTDLGGHQVVLSDRYYLSGLAYHRADGIETRWYRLLNQHVRRPDVYLLLDIDMSMARSRAGARDGRWEEPDLAGRLPAAYAEAEALAIFEDAARVCHLDASAPAGTVLKAAMTVLEGLL